MHDLSDPVHEHKHVIAELPIDILEVVDIAEAEDGVDAQTREERVNRCGRVLGGQVRGDDVGPGLAEPHAQQAWIGSREGKRVGRRDKEEGTGVRS